MVDGFGGRMKFNKRAKLDRSQLQDRRGQRSAGGGMPGLPGSSGGGGLPGGIPTGGGVAGLIIIVIVFVLVSQCGGGGLPGLGGGGGGGNQENTSEACQSGADTDAQDCRILASVNSIQGWWEEGLPDQAGVQYEEADYVTFDGSTSSQCGQASSAMGPFYCPVDKLVYLDLTFFDQMLEGQLGATGGDAAEAYVLAHEYGHHIQDILGTLAKNQSRETGPNSPGVRIELQADCYAGVWVHHATEVTDEDGEPYITEISPDDISEALDAAKAVGDDRIQQQTSGRVNEEQWTHGSAASRQKWFNVGYESGDMRDCDTFSTNNL